MDSRAGEGAQRRPNFHQNYVAHAKDFLTKTLVFNVNSEERLLDHMVFHMNIENRLPIINRKHWFFMVLIQILVPAPI